MHAAWITYLCISLSCWTKAYSTLDWIHKWLMLLAAVITLDLIPSSFSVCFSSLHFSFIFLDPFAPLSFPRHLSCPGLHSTSFSFLTSWYVHTMRYSDGWIGHSIPVRQFMHYIRLNVNSTRFPLSPTQTLSRRVLVPFVPSLIKIHF